MAGEAIAAVLVGAITIVVGIGGWWYRRERRQEQVRQQKRQAFEYALMAVTVLREAVDTAEQQCRRLRSGELDIQQFLDGYPVLHEEWERLGKPGPLRAFLPDEYFATVVRITDELSEYRVRCAVGEAEERCNRCSSMMYIQLQTLDELLKREYHSTFR